MNAPPPRSAAPAQAPTTPALPVRRSLAVLLVAVVVIAVVWGVAPATLVLGAVLVVAATLRLVFPPLRVATLVVRSRALDVAILGVLGVAIAVLGQIAPVS